MYNALRNYRGDTTVIVDGVAASIASVIALGAKKVLTQPRSMWMIHNAWLGVMGNSHELRAAADTLEKIDQNLVSIYANKTGQSRTVCADMMERETWFTSEEAMAVGLVDGIAETPPQASKAAKAKNHLNNLETPAMQKAKTLILPKNAFDPGGDRYDDAQEAIGLIDSAAALLNQAMEALSGTDDADTAADPSDSSMSTDMMDLERAVTMRRKIAAMLLADEDDLSK